MCSFLFGTLSVLVNSSCLCLSSLSVPSIQRRVPGFVWVSLPTLQHGNSLEAINGGSPDTWHLFSFFSGFTFYFLMICIFYSVLLVSYGRVNPYYSIWPEAKVIYLILFNILPVFLLFQFEQLRAELARSIGSWGLRLKPLHDQEIPEFLNMWLLIWIFEVMVLDFLFYEFSHA